jgi:uncharacterized protein YjbI with pentapeptide repeats
MADKEEKKDLTKAELEREKLALENIRLRRETTKNLWWYLSKAQAIIPIATLIVTVVVLYNQTQTEKRRVESETVQQFAATVKDLESKSRSIRLGAVLLMENFIPLGEQYRGQIYLLLGNLLKEEAQGVRRDSIMIHHICESFRKLSNVRLAENDAAVSLYLIDAKFGRLFLHLFDLRGAELWKANLEGAQLREASLDSAKLWKANLSAANLESAVLTKANLQEAHLRGTNLEGADLWEANLEGADFRGANLIKANLERAHLPGAKNLTLEQLSEVKTLYYTELDSSLLEQVKEKYPHLLERPKEE